MITSMHDNSDVYYKGLYWNDVPEVYKYMCRNFTGDENKWWVEDFKERYAVKPFEHALFINCGNGRMEREFIDKNIVKSADAFDYSEVLLKEAKSKRLKRDIAYFKADADRIELPENRYDLIVNVAGLHHVQYINRFIYVLGKSLKEGGVMVSFDYIGPHRNQYSYSQWKLANKINSELPTSIRHDRLLYPSVPVMLQEDPTEAIHSELTMKTVERYFDIIERHDTGGGIAYLLLTHNPKVKNEGILPEIKKILDYDKQYSDQKIVPPLFSYFIASPNQKLLSDTQLFSDCQNKENQREEWADRLGGVYRMQDYFNLLFYLSKKWVKKIVK